MLWFMKLDKLRIMMIANLNLKLGWFRAAALGIFDPLGMRAAAIDQAQTAEAAKV